MEKPCIWSLIILAQLFFIGHGGYLPNYYTRDILRHDTNEDAPDSPLILLVNSNKVIMSNGIVSVTFSNPDGAVTDIKYGNIENILDTANRGDNRGYWDVAWNGGAAKDSMFYDSDLNMNGDGDGDGDGDEESMFFYSDLLNKATPMDRLDSTSFKVIEHREDQIEISFSKKWNSNGGAPLNVDKRFIMRRKSSGFYAYGIFERQSDFPASRIDQIRIVFKLHEDLFDYMAISDKIQNEMPSNRERAMGLALNYPEAVRLKNGQVDDKYEYSLNNHENRLHGWISKKGVGFWIITPSNEFRNGGPLKQDLTSHCGPTALSMFVSTHYTGLPLAMHFENKEPWKKVFGPVFIYLNSNKTTQSMWEDAKAQTTNEIRGWPYNFPRSDDFPHSDQRGAISGTLEVRDGSITLRGAYAYVGLAAPGDVGSWQFESKGYQFWTEADKAGNFIIEGVRPGNYNLFAWVPGFIGDYKYGPIVTISPGSNEHLNNILYEPPRTGKTLWEIGYPDRTAAEFYIPEPNENHYNNVFKNFDKFRQYGLWERYTNMYPQDLVYTLGSSVPTKDWFFAHVTRNSQENVFEGTTWQIVFDLKNVENAGNYTLRLAIAGASAAELQVRVNKNENNQPYFTTGLIGTENIIARHGIHGLYRLYSVSFGRDQLVTGKNVIYLKQARGKSPFTGLMYDYIRLEAPRI